MYLYERHYYVRVNNERSNLFEIKAGIPQGSFLGPVLYKIFAGDVPTISDVTIANYADDTAIVATNNCLTESSTRLQREVNILGS